ncbi:hypothetical protein Mal4_09900 [Maioricimonas rarisocia]|uniref:F-box/LRR-repeat protein 15/At3g58940/PEG3-like LRR domain-containing protein n=1 Tax=Maioricimonas rarisocia TaxID=2528026 RepID=A0A517Z2J9_9PLAN|nr:hypothetical protein [Maioricimonas rarisocia]QDU36701.1 hypothetical protein Mal4_09900 [Maioricimonas rarisocia]
MSTTTEKPPIHFSHRAVIGWCLVAAIAIPVLLSQLEKFEQERSVRLLRETGAEVRVGLDGKQIVAAEFEETTIDEATVRRMLEHQAIRRLSFTTCQFEAGTLRKLAALPELDSLDLRQPVFDAPDDLNGLLEASRLISLTLTDLAATPEPLQINTDRLRSVQLYRCGTATVALIEELAAAPSLRALRCEGTPLPLELCRRIHHERSDVDFEISADEICEYQPLTSRGARLVLNEDLDVVGLTIRRGSDPVPPDLILQLPKLRTVQLHHIDVDRGLLEALAQLQSPVSLSLVGSRIDADDLLLLAALPQLRRLHLDELSTRTGEEVELPSLPRLKTLTANSAAINDRALDGLAPGGLEIVSLGRTVTRRGLQRLLAPGTVHTLALSGRPVDADLLETIRSCSRLQNLLLFGCTVKEELLAEASLPEELKTLRLAGTRVSKETIEALRAAYPQLQVFFW